MKEAPEIKMSLSDFQQWDLRDPVGLRDHLFKTYGDISKLVIGDFENYFLMHPDYAQVVFSEKQDDFFNRHPLLVAGFEPLLGTETIFTLKDPVKWEERRNIALRSMDVPVFFERYVNTSYEVGKKRIDEWSKKYADNEAINISHEMDSMVISFVNHSFLYYIDDQPEEIRVMLHRTNKILADKETAENPQEWETPEKKKLVDDTFDSFRETYKRWVRTRINSGKNIDDFMGLMLHLLSKTFTGEDLIVEVSHHVAMASATSLFTTSTALHYLLVELAKNPEVANKVREEISRIVGDGTPTYEQFRKMDYCSAVIKESQRLNSNAFSILRQAVVNTSIKEYSIPEGAGIAVSTGIIHRHPDFWKDPDKFIPERFLEKPMGQDHLFAYIPFGAGKRACIARHFSPLEMLVALVLIARNYNLELVPNKPIKDMTLAPGFLMRPSEDHLIIRKL